jgi:4-amino-4-deoxy-L-arabinose transferase-like glycosyltransferase
MENALSPRSEKGTEEHLVMGILAGGALLFRLLFLVSRPVLSGDELHYAESLFRFMHGRFLEGISDYWSFLYPLAAAPFGYLARDAETGLRLLSVLSGAALVIPVYLIAKRLWGRRAAVFAGILVALQPNLLAFSTSALTEPFYSLLLLCAAFAFLRGMETGALRAFATAGALLALAALARPEAAVFLPLAAAAVLAGRGGPGLRAPFISRLARAAVVAALFAAVCVPYLTLIHAATGRWTTGSKAAVNLSSPVIWQDGLAREEYVYSLNAEGSARRIEEIGRENPLGVLWRERGAIASRYPGRFWAGVRLIPHLLTSPFLLILVPLGLFARRWRRPGAGAEILLLFLGAFPFAFYSLFRVEIRYLVPYLPVYLLWAGAGCAVLLGWFAGVRWKRRFHDAALVLLVAVGLAPYGIVRCAVAAKSQPREWVEIGRWIGAHDGPGARILAMPGCSISYYAGNPMATFIPWTDEAGLVRYARLNRYDLIVIDDAYIRAERPALRPILESPPGGLELLKRFDTSSGAITIYRLTASS